MKNSKKSYWSASDIHSEQVEANKAPTQKTFESDASS